MDEITVMIHQLTADPPPPHPTTAARAERLLDKRIRGRVVRPRSAPRTLAAAGALALAIGAGAGVADLLQASPPAGHTAITNPLNSHAAKVRLAAWSVAELGHGDIRVTVRDLRDPVGLQARLRADGIPANVSYTSANRPSASCQPTRATFAEVDRVYTFLRRGPTAVLLIHQSTLPSGDGVYLYVPTARKFPKYVGLRVIGALMKTSHACTG